MNEDYSGVYSTGYKQGGDLRIFLKNWDCLLVRLANSPGSFDIGLIENPDSNEPYHLCIQENATLRDWRKFFCNSIEDTMQLYYYVQKQKINDWLNLDRDPNDFESEDSP